MNSALNKKYKMLLIVALTLAPLVMAGVFYFFYRLNQNDTKALAEFSASYKEFDKAVSVFSVPVLSANLEGGIPALDEFNKIYGQITASLQNTRPNADRLELAKKAITLNKSILDSINKTDGLERKAGETFVELSAKTAALSRVSSVTQNYAKLRSTGAALTDSSAKELNTLVEYKKVLLKRRYITHNLLQKIVDDKGGLDGFIKFLSQEDNQAELQKQNEDLDRLSKEFGEIKDSRTVTYARFQELLE